MDQRRAGRTGLRLSVLGLSTRSWGRHVDSDAASTALASFRDAGGTFVDTTSLQPAAVAAATGAREEALSRGESMLGALLTGDRNAMTVAAGPPTTVANGCGGASRSALLGALTDTLRRLRCDYVDLWQVPTAPPAAARGARPPGEPAAGVPMEETLAALDSAVASGKVRYVGLSEPVAWRLARAATWQQAWPGRTPIAADQLTYSLLDRTAETELLDAAGELQVGIVCSAAGPATPGDRAADARTAGLIEAIATAADGLATTALAVSLSWLRMRPAVTSMVVDARNPAHLAAALASLDLTLPEPIARVLDEVSAPPRRSGPQ